MQPGTPSMTRVIPRRSPPMHIIARNPSQLPKLRAALLSHRGSGEDINSIGKRGETILHAAVRGNNLDAVACLVQVHPELLAQEDVKGETPVQTAIKLKPNSPTGKERQLKMLTTMLAAKDYDVNRFSNFVKVKKPGAERRSWRLNALRFAIVFNADSAILDLLEAHGAVVGHDPLGTDKPLNEDELKKLLHNRMSGGRHRKRIPFFEGLACCEVASGTTVGQRFVLHQHPAAAVLGSPHLKNIMNASANSPAQVPIIEHLVGSHLVGPLVLEDYCADFRLLSQFVLDVVAVEGVVSRHINVGRALRGIRTTRPAWQQLWDALLVNYCMSSHQKSQFWDYRVFAHTSVRHLEIEELQAPVLFEAADLV